MSHVSRFVEGLESRQLMAGISATMAGGMLRVTGTSAGEGIYVEQSAGYVKVRRPLKNGDLKTVYAVKWGKVNSIWVSAGAGNDYVDLRKVYDFICFVDAGKDNDRVYGSDCADEIYGKQGNDEVHAFDGNDRIEGGDGNDTLLGQNDDDYIVGGAGVDKMTGGSGNDEIFARDSSILDYISGGPGDDWCSADRDMAYEDVLRYETGVQAILGDIESIG